MGWLCSPVSPRRACPGDTLISTLISLVRAMQGKLDQEDLGVALEVQLTLAFMQLGGEFGGRVVHTGREKFLGELSPKLGKPKKHPAYCIYLAYRLDRGGSGEERGVGEGELSGERAAGSATPSSLQWEGEEEDDDEANQVVGFVSATKRCFSPSLVGVFHSINPGYGRIGGQAAIGKADNGGAGK